MPAKWFWPAVSRAQAARMFPHNCVISPDRCGHTPPKSSISPNYAANRSRYSGRQRRASMRRQRRSRPVPLTSMSTHAGPPSSSPTPAPGPTHWCRMCFTCCRTPSAGGGAGRPPLPVPTSPRIRSPAQPLPPTIACTCRRRGRRRPSTMDGCGSTQPTGRARSTT